MILAGSLTLCTITARERPEFPDNTANPLARVSVCEPLFSSPGEGRGRLIR